MGGPHGRCLHLDSSADWFTTEALCRDAIALKRKMVEFKALRPQVPDLPTPHEWRIFEGLLQVLEQIGAGMRILQTNQALACQVLSVFTDIRVQLEDACVSEDAALSACSALALFEFHGMMRRNINKPVRLTGIAHSSLMLRILADIGVSSYGVRIVSSRTLSLSDSTCSHKDRETKKQFALQA